MYSGGMSLILLLLSCGSGAPQSKAPPAVEDSGETFSENPACIGAPAVTWESWGHGFFLTWCASCHSASAPERRGAPTGVDFDSQADVKVWSERIRIRVLEEGTMPIGGGLYEDDALLLDLLLACQP